MLVHAAGESSPGNLPHDTHAIVLAVPNEPALVALAERLAKAGIAHVTIREPDSPWNNALMAIGLVPGRKEVLRRYLSSIPLLK
jgi:hypothetical protein